MKPHLLTFLLFSILTLSCSKDDDSNNDTVTYPELTEGAIIISEIMINPDAVSDADGEWFEVYNTSSTNTYNLEGATISNNSQEFQITQELLINPNSFLVFGRNDDISTNGGITVDYQYPLFPLPNSVPDKIKLSKNSITIFDYAYAASFYANSSGKSINLKPDVMTIEGMNNLSNWCTSTNQLNSGDFGTPKTINTDCF